MISTKKARTKLILLKTKSPTKTTSAENATQLTPKNDSLTKKLA